MSTRPLFPLIILATIATTLTLSGCGEETPTAREPAASQSSTAAETPDSKLVPVNPADLPDWFPADLPMPEGSYFAGERYECDGFYKCDYGFRLKFTVSGLEVAEKLVLDLNAAGYGQTQVTDWLDSGGKTWFTEGQAFRANVVVSSLDEEVAYLDYNIEPQDPANP